MQNALSDELRAKLSQLISTTRQGVLAGYPLRHVRVGDAQHSRNLAALANQPDSGVTRIKVPLDPAERTRFVRQWMEKHQRKLASGALATTLVLPMLAQAAEGKMVDAGDLKGVVNAEILADGNVQIIFEDGRVVQFGSAHAQVVGERILVDAEALQSALDVATIPAVQLSEVAEAVVNDDGTASLTMQDGLHMLIQPESMEVQGGQVMMTQAQVAGAGLETEAAFVSPFAGIGMSDDETVSYATDTSDSAMGGLTGVQIAAGAVGLGVVAALASSSSSSSSSPSTVPEPTPEPEDPDPSGPVVGDPDDNQIRGNVQDGYIVNADVTFLDAEGNQVGSTTTSDEAGFEGDFDSEVSGAISTIEVRNGVDIATGKAFAGVLKAPADADTDLQVVIISPLTTLIHAQVQQGNSIAEAETSVREALGLGDLGEDGRTLLNFDAWGDDTEVGQAVAKVGMQVAALIQIASANADNTDVDDDRFTELMNEFALRLGDGTLDLSDPATYESNVREFLTSNGVSEEQAESAARSSTIIREAESREAAAEVQRDSVPGEVVEAPTDAPTDEPADEPTDEPTDEPADEPADEPTEAPTDGPTETPVETVDSESALAEAQALDLRASLQERLTNDIAANLSGDEIGRDDLDALIAYREAIQHAVNLAEAGDGQAFFNGSNAPDLTAILNNLVGLNVDGIVFSQANANTAIAIVSDVDALASANPAQLNAFTEVAFSTLTGGVDSAQFSTLLGELATQLNDESVSIGGLSLDAQSVTQLKALFDGLGADAQAVALASAQDLQINELLDPQAFFTEAFAEALKLEVENNDTLSSLAVQESLISVIEKGGQLEGKQFEAADFGSDGLIATLANQVDSLLATATANPSLLPAGVEVDGDTVSFNGLSLSVSQLESAVTGYGNLNPESQATYLQSLNNPDDLSLLTDPGTALETQLVQNIASATEDQVIALGVGDYEGVAGVISGSGDDNIIGSSLDNTIDISAGGSDTLTFAASLTENGADTVVGFSAGAAASGGDVIAFDSLPTDLGGNAFEVNPSAELGADTGLLVFTTTAGLEPSVLGLTEGDTVMVLEVADNGEDAQLLKVDIGASDSVAEEQLATFEGLGGNLGSIVDENLQDFNLTTV